VFVLVRRWRVGFGLRGRGAAIERFRLQLRRRVGDLVGRLGRRFELRPVRWFELRLVVVELRWLRFELGLVHVGLGFFRFELQFRRPFELGLLGVQLRFVRFELGLLLRFELGDERGERRGSLRGGYRPERRHAALLADRSGHSERPQLVHLVEWSRRVLDDLQHTCVQRLVEQYQRFPGP
jgi:hypothetical protein